MIEIERAARARTACNSPDPQPAWRKVNTRMVDCDRLTQVSTENESKHSGRRWRKSSVFGTGARAPLCREKRAVWKARIRLLIQAKKLTHATVRIAEAMLGMLGNDGRLDPSKQHIADVTGTDRSTVTRALDLLRSFRLITWERRITRNGWRVEQTSNAYCLTCEAHFAQEVSQLRLRDKKGRKSASLTTSSEAQAVARSLTAGSGAGPRPSDLTDEQAIANRDRQLRLLMGG